MTEMPKHSVALDAKVPEGPLADKWTNHKNSIRLVNPANKRLIDVIVVGTGLAGSSAAASLALGSLELGRNLFLQLLHDLHLLLQLPLLRHGVEFILPPPSKEPVPRR